MRSFGDRRLRRNEVLQLHVEFKLGSGSCDDKQWFMAEGGTTICSKLEGLIWPQRGPVQVQIKASVRESAQPN